MRRSPTVYAAVRVAALVLCLLMACTAEPHLPLPDVDGVQTWIVVASTLSRVRAEVLDPSGAVHLEPDGLTIEALAFTHALDVPLGPLAAQTEGEPLPSPDDVFAADVEELRWDRRAPSAAVATLRLPPRADDCPRFTTKAVRLTDSQPSGAQAMLSIDDARVLVVTSGEWFVITKDEVTPITPVLTSVRAVTRAPGGRFWLARDDELWTASGASLLATTATLARRLPDRLLPFVLAAPSDDVVYGLSTDGHLFRSDTATTTVVHRFQYRAAASRGAVIVDGAAIVAGLAFEGKLVRIEDGIKQITTLPSSSDGVVSIARFAELGLVIGSNNGGLLASSLDYQPVPDPLGQTPYGVQLHALRPYGDRLLFAGSSGAFGEITALRYVCQSLPAASNVRFVEALGDQILAVGASGVPNSDDVTLTRYLPQP